jgi:hypothetical protein
MGIFDLFGPPNVEKMLAKKDVEGLIKALRHKEANVRAKAAQALGKVGDVRAVKPLISAMKDAALLGYDAAEARAKIGPHAAKLLISALLLVREAAAEALAKLGTPAVEPLILALQDSNGHVRDVVTEALAKFGTPAVEPLISALKDEDINVRRMSANALGKIGAASSIESLINALSDNDISIDVAGALKCIGGPEVERALKEHRTVQTVPQEYEFDDAIEKMVTIYREHPQGFVQGQGGAPEQELRLIGKILNQKGGMDLMRAAHAEFTSRCAIRGASRNLEFIWDGIGNWQG